MTDRLKVQSLLNSGKEWMLAGNLREAEQNYTDALAYGPEFPLTYLLRAAVYSKLNNQQMSNDDLMKYASYKNDWVKIKPIISGYLRKEAPNKMTGTAKKRYFFLKNRFMFYYKQPFDPEPISIVYLGDFKVTALDPRRKEFKIELPHRVFALEADTPEDKGDWVNALNVANKTEAFMIDVLNDSTSFNPKEKEVVKEGFVFKRGQHNKSWKQRWFKLQGHFLLYSAAKADEPLGLIDLQAVRRCAAHDEAEGTNMYQFSLETPNRVFFMYAEDRGVRNEWMQVIQNILGSENFVRKSAPNSRGNSVHIGRARNSIPTPLTPAIGETESNEDLKYSKKISGFHRTDSPADTTIEVTKLEPVSSKRRDETEKEVERRRNEEAIRKNKLKAKVKKDELKEPFLLEDDESVGEKKPEGFFARVFGCCKPRN
jgi:hypothetical protein